MSILLVSFAAWVAPIPTPVETTLCALVERPTAFAGKVVRFRAGVLTDWHHGMVLVHSGCQGGVELSSTDAVPPNQAKVLEGAIGTPLDRRADRTAMATFTGQFSLRSGKRQYAFDNLLKFKAQRIEGVLVYSRNERR